MKAIYKDLKIIGADETGVGDYLTPLVAAAVFVPPQYISKLEAMGITDSKKLTDKKILELFEKIKPLIKSSVRHLSQKGYNKLNTSFNAHELKTIIHLQAINAVESRVDNIDLVILDQFVNENSFNKYVSRLEKSSLDIPPIKRELKMVTKGEMEHVSVAAASIVARAYFLKMMESQNKRYDMTFPLGTNDRAVTCAKEFVNKYGAEKLNEVAKLSFKTTEKVI
ncbi:ribonuclease HIII [Mycoplasma todarodis]|uniref:Ribonuclease n=1 Tax=Mycoplasma todarodis TaxID=1937191 RepID=A0A4R0XJS2_9MOLU|nr:ribonuclease HIII [Mycoplasma todarodis]TCG10896.1 ribonuclease HIII [Mycoplasma todarodis]